MSSPKWERKEYLSLCNTQQLLATKYRTWKKEITNTKKIIGNWFLELKASPRNIGLEHGAPVALCNARGLSLSAPRDGEALAPPSGAQSRLTLPGPRLLVKVCVSLAKLPTMSRPMWPEPALARDTEDWIRRENLPIRRWSDKLRALAHDQGQETGTWGTMGCWGPGHLIPVFWQSLVNKCPTLHVVKLNYGPDTS